MRNIKQYPITLDEKVKLLSFHLGEAYAKQREHIGNIDVATMLEIIKDVKAYDEVKGQTNDQHDRLRSQLD